MQTLAIPSAGATADRESLSTAEICAAIAQLLEVERQTEWLLCSHLAELADRFERRAPELRAFADIYQCARLRFGMSVRRVRERVRVGRALRRLPEIQRAFVDGALGYAKVREVTRVAEPESEARWLATASAIPLRTLERRVAEATIADGDDREQTSEPAATRWATPRSIELRVTLPAAAWALLERAMEGARQRSESSLSDAEALEAVARDALAAQTEGKDRADPRNMVVTYACRDCGRAEVETGRGGIELDANAMAIVACTAKHCNLDKEGQTVTHRSEVPAAVRRAVMLRDRMRCRAPGCNGRRYVDVHHVKAREECGEHSRRNCLVLCTRCHSRVHEGSLRIEGDADHELAFYDGSGQRLGVEMTPRGHAEANLSSPAMALLKAMGTRGAWHPDTLCDETGLRASDVTSGLLELLLLGLVRRDESFAYGAAT